MYFFRPGVIDFLKSPEYSPSVFNFFAIFLIGVFAMATVIRPDSPNDDDTGNVEAATPASAVPETVAPSGEENKEASSVPAATNDQLNIESLGRSHLIEGFDPAIHAVNTDGTPRMKADGTFANKRGRKGSNTSGTRLSSRENTTKKVIASQISPETYTMTAIPIVMCIEQMGLQIGPEWKMNDEEKDAQVGTWANYLRSKGIVEISPSMMLVIVSAGYVIPRLSVENTQTKIQKLMRNFAGFRSRLASIFGR